VSLLKRGNIWWSYFFVDGIRHQHSTNTANRKQAEAIEQKLKLEANARRHQLVQVDPGMTFGALSARFIVSGSMKDYVPDRLKRLLPYFSDTPIVRITKNTALEYRQYRRTVDHVSDSTVNRDLATLRRILYWAVDESLLLSNPLTRVRLERERRTRRPVMSLDEENKVLAQAAEHLRHLIIAALDTGMRRGEILHQQWEDVDLPRRLLAVSHSKTPEGESREIPLTNRLTELLSEIKQETGPVFRYNNVAIVANFDSSWQRALRLSGVRHFRFHDLRHSFNTRLMEAGVIADVRKALMGHTSGDRVHSIYTHVELPIKRQAIARLEDWVKQQAEQPKGEHHANAEAERTETDSRQNGEPKTVEEEDAR
jgi:integrase